MVLAVSSAAMASAQADTTYTVSLLGTVGGALDVDPDAGLGHAGLQLGFAYHLERGTAVAFRLGSLGLDDSDGFGTLAEADLRYLTVGGEYRFADGPVVSGLYLALGVYDLDARHRDGSDAGDTSLGASLGISADLPVQRRWSVVLELAAHFADFDDAELFATGSAGVAYHF